MIYFEYNGMKLTAKKIAEMEGINYGSLRMNYDIYHDIYYAVNITRENTQHKILYNGEYLSIRAIAQKAGVLTTTLLHKYRELGDINNAVELARDVSLVKIKYNGKETTLKEISRAEGIEYAILNREYKKTNNIDEAITMSKGKKIKSFEKICYKGEMLSLAAIALREGLESERLARIYKETKDIQTAIEKTRVKARKKIEYNGQMLTRLEIAKKEGIPRSTFYRNLEKSQENGKLEIKTVEKVVAATNSTKKETITYKGEVITLSKIAQMLNLNYKKLCSIFKIYKNIDKAIMLSQNTKGSNGLSIDTIDLLAKEFDVSKLQLHKLLDKGESISELEKKIIKRPKLIMNNGTSLHQYCFANKLNYRVINYMITTYGKTNEEAIDNYKHNGQNIPSQWIYSKYGILFKHLMLNHGVDSNGIVKIMKEELINVSGAISKYIFMKQTDGISQIEKEWNYELYQYLEGCSKEGFDDAIKDLYISSKELQYIKVRKEKVDVIKKQLLLYEFSKVVDLWPIEETTAMMKEYNISNKDVEEMCLNLYKPFKSGILTGEKSLERKRAELVNGFVLTALAFKDERLIELTTFSADEKKYIRLKVEKIAYINSHLNKEEDKQLIKKY